MSCKSGQVDYGTRVQVFFAFVVGESLAVPSTITMAKAERDSCERLLKGKAEE